MVHLKERQRPESPGGISNSDSVFSLTWEQQLKPEVLSAIRDQENPTDKYKEDADKADEVYNEWKPMYQKYLQCKKENDDEELRLTVSSLPKRMKWTLFTQGFGAGVLVSGFFWLIWFLYPPETQST